MDELKATPEKIPGLVALAKRLRQADEFARRPFGYENPPLGMLSDLLGLPAVAATAERMGYGEPLTTGKGMTTRLRPETIEAALAVAPGIPATKGLPVGAATKRLEKTPAEIQAAYKAQFTPGFYHASGASDIEHFIPSHRGAIFATRDPKFANAFHPIDETASVSLPSEFSYLTGSTTYPISINLGKHFDVDTPQGKKFVEGFLEKRSKHIPQSVGPRDPYNLENYLGNQSWAVIENKDFMQALKEAGYDTFSIREGGVKNVGVLDPKNIRGRFAEYNPEHAESPEFMKAAGGLIHLR